MQQLTNEEKEALSIFSKKYNVKPRIYFFEKNIHIFIKKRNEFFPKITFDNDISSFKFLLRKIESIITNKK